MSSLCELHILELPRFVYSMTELTMMPLLQKFDTQKIVKVLINDAINWSIQHWTSVLTLFPSVKTLELCDCRRIPLSAILTQLPVLVELRLTTCIFDSIEPTACCTKTSSFIQYWMPHRNSD